MVERNIITEQYYKTQRKIKKLQELMRVTNFGKLISIEKSIDMYIDEIEKSEPYKIREKRKASAKEVKKQC